VSAVLLGPVAVGCGLFLRSVCTLSEDYSYRNRAPKLLAVSPARNQHVMTEAMIALWKLTMAINFSGSSTVKSCTGHLNRFSSSNYLTPNKTDRSEAIE
jgi:hypothetical protein